MTTRLLVPERGLYDTRRNRRWLALVALIETEQLVRGGDQDKIEKLAWKIIKTWEGTP